LVVAGIVGVIGFWLNLAIGLGVGLVLAWGPALFGRMRSSPWSSRFFPRFPNENAQR
jgi:hypothetical protein